jgi:hypothetical protein
MTLIIEKPTGAKLVMAKGFTPESYMYEFPALYPVWTPVNITTALWLDAASESTITQSSGSVSQWNDRSGNDRNATQSTAANQPIIASGLNSRRSLNFDGNGDNLVLPTGFLNGATAFSIAFAMLGPLQSNDAIFGPATSNSTGLELVYTNIVSSPTLVRINNVNKFTSGLWSTNSQPAISVLQADASATAGWLNGSTVSAVSATGIAALNFNGVYSIGTYSSNATGQGSSGTNVSAQMNLGEFIISTTVWSLSDRQKVEGYLAHKWGLTANLPSDHPYKTVGPTP